MAKYSSGSALKNFKIYSRAPSTRCVAAIEVGLVECGFPKTFSLKQNYPNPFNPSTTIEFSLPVVSYVDIKVYDILGREIKTLTHKKYFPGIYKIDFNALNLASGMYIYRIIANDENNSSYIKTMKMILTK